MTQVNGDSTTEDGVVGTSKFNAVRESGVWGFNKQSGTVTPATLAVTVADPSDVPAANQPDNDPKPEDPPDGQLVRIQGSGRSWVLNQFGSEVPDIVVLQLDAVFVGPHGEVNVMWVSDGAWAGPAVIAPPGTAVPGSHVVLDSQPPANQLDAFFVGPQGGSEGDVGDRSRRLAGTGSHRPTWDRGTWKLTCHTA